MSSGRRITIGLVGLVLLVIVGYLVNDLTHHHSAAACAVTQTLPVCPI